MKKTMRGAAVAVIAGTLGLSAVGETLALATKNLKFEIEADATAARFVLPANGKTDGDFWRLILDDGERVEMPVMSRHQRGRVARRGEDALVIAYDEVKTEYGDTYPIRLTLEVVRRGELLAFTPTVENRARGVRVNECFAPLVTFDGVAGPKKDDVIFMPKGLGQRAGDPYAKMESLSQYYYNHDQHETFWHQPYPRASMCWFGVQSGDKFLYVSRQDPELRLCFLTARHTIKGGDLMLGIDHWPMATEGETLTFAPTVVGLLDGGWRAGADDYRRWAEGAFYKAPPCADERVRRMTGFSRLVLKTSFGEDCFKISDIPRMYERTRACGLDGLFLFAWWRRGMDRSYPDYVEAYPGAFDELRRNLEEVRRRGGFTILECNFTFMSKDTPYWREHGEATAMRDIWGEYVTPSFGYPGYGEYCYEFGKRKFYEGCTGTRPWRDQMARQVRLLGELGGDVVFMDCFGGAPFQGCFDARHEHGKRVDADWRFRRLIYQDAADHVKSIGRTLGNEIVTDVAASYSPFIHGLVNVTLDPTSEEYPPMFRYTFPKLITTNRGMHGSDQPRWEEKLRSCLVYGLRFDAELYVCRGIIDEDPPYAKVVRECADTMRKYGEFYFDGTFTVVDDTPLPRAVKRGDFLNADGTKRLTVWYNTSKKPYKTGVGKLVLKPGQMKFVVSKLP